MTGYQIGEPPDGYGRRGFFVLSSRSVDVPLYGPESHANKIRPLSGTTYPTDPSSSFPLVRRGPRAAVESGFPSGWIQEPPGDVTARRA